MNTTLRTFALGSYEVRFSRGPSDPRLHACTACRYEVESVDGRGRCDECACDDLRTACDEVSTFDFAAAIALGRVSFEAHARFVYERELAACHVFNAEVDARIEATIADQLADERDPFECPECEGCGLVRAWNMSPEADCDLDECPTCFGAGTLAPAAEVA